MRLEPTPKPVRIRIKSSGTEHSSLPSLLENFSYEDVYPLILDKRFSRWLRQVQQFDVADRIDRLFNEGKLTEDNIASIKYLITGALFDAPNIVDESSLLEYFYSYPEADYKKNFKRELDSLPFSELESLFKQKKTEVSYRGDIAFLLGEKAEDKKYRIKYLKEALKLGVLKAKVPLVALEEAAKQDKQHTKTPTKITAKPKVDATLKGEIDQLSYDYWNTRPFPVNKNYSRQVGPYFLFIEFAYKNRQASGIYTLSELWKGPKGSIEYWEPYQAIVDSFLYLHEAYIKVSGDSQSPSYSRRVYNMRVPSDCQRMLIKVEKGEITTFINAIDSLCKDYWKYLEEQNKKWQL